MVEIGFSKLRPTTCSSCSESFPISFFEESQGMYVKKSGQSTTLEMVISKIHGAAISIQ